MCELGSGDECVCVCVHVCILLSTPPFCIWKGSWDKPRVESSHILVCWESDIVTAEHGCDSVDAISTMWTHTGYAPHLVTW